STRSTPGTSSCATGSHGGCTASASSTPRTGTGSPKPKGQTMSVPYLPDAADRAAAWNGVVAWYVAGVVALFAVAVMAWLIERRGHVMSPLMRDAAVASAALLIMCWSAFGYLTLYAYHVSRRV